MVTLDMIHLVSATSAPTKLFITLSPLGVKVKLLGISCIPQKTSDTKWFLELILPRVHCPITVKTTWGLYLILVPNDTSSFIAYLGYRKEGVRQKKIAKYKNLDSKYLGESDSEHKKATTVSLHSSSGFKRPFPHRNTFPGWIPRRYIQLLEIHRPVCGVGRAHGRHSLRSLFLLFEMIMHFIWILKDTEGVKHMAMT